MSAPRQVRRCYKCVEEGINTRRKAPHRGPNGQWMCATHKRQARKNQKEARKANHVERTYNITEEQYQAILEAQGGHCAICPRRPGRKRLSVDHDHSCCPGPKSCGKCVRGLLCSTCNKYLGHIRDDPDAMVRGWQYLLSPPAYRVLGVYKV